MQAVAVLNVVGLSGALLPHAPRIRAYAGGNRLVRLSPVLPAVTCSVQASMLTGLSVAEHGIVGNGWYDRETCEVRFWQRSARLMRGEKVWEAAKGRDASFTCANLFWWFNSYSTCDYVVQARPIYKADGRKIPDCYAEPYDLRDRLQAELGRFPLFRFWGPLADITSTRWIAEAAKRVAEWHAPTLSLVYLPHLDYGLQKLGPDHPDIPQHVAEVDAVVGELLDFYAARGTRVIIVSEYGIEGVDHPVAINRVLREAGLLRVRDEEGLEQLDPGACEAFAVADHQVAHVYLPKADRGGRFDVAACTALLRGVPGVARVIVPSRERELGLDSPRAGDLVLVAQPRCWFTYDYWLTPDKAPDFARTVDIHRKPGYDPRELYSSKTPPQVGWRLLKRKLGFRTLLDVVPLDASLVKGSHGRLETDASLRPVMIAPHSVAPDADETDCRGVKGVVLDALASREPLPSPA